MIIDLKEIGECLKDTPGLYHFMAEVFPRSGQPAISFCAYKQGHKIGEFDNWMECVAAIQKFNQRDEVLANLTEAENKANELRQKLAELEAAK